MVTLFVAVLTFMDSSSPDTINRELAEDSAEKENPQGSTNSTGDDPTSSGIKKKKPLMHTFFEPNGACCGMSEQGHHMLLDAWKASLNCAKIVQRSCI